MDRRYTLRGFLPEQDPLRSFKRPRFAVLDELGRDLPSLRAELAMARRQPDVLLGRIDRCVRARGKEAIPVGHLCASDRVVGSVRPAAEPVEDQQDHWARA